jgi:ligand-binding sensor domain-containing protein
MKVSAQPVTPFTFTRYTMATGLLSNEVRSVVQDRTGYIWIATNNGLQRFDGVHYKTFQHRDNDPTSLPANFLIQLLLDNDDQLWVVSADGQVGRFDKSKFTYTPVGAKAQKPGSIWAIKRLIKDDAGHLFSFLLEGAELLIMTRTR